LLALPVSEAAVDYIAGATENLHYDTDFVDPVS
jgi:hypothetical protein